MTRVEITRRLLIVEKERDELREQVCRLRDKLLEFAASCARCGGTGMQTDYVDEHNEFIPEGDRRRDTGRAVTSDCEDCADLREALGG